MGTERVASSHEDVRYGGPAPIGGGQGGLALLTPREREVLALMAEGLSTAIIAERLVISITTVRSHVHSIIDKLEVHSRLQAVLTAYELSPKGTSEAGRTRIS